MHIMKTIDILKILLCFIPSNAFANLVFDSTVIKDTIIAGTSSYDFKFTFKNAGDTPVEILGIKTTCGCTIVKNDKDIYASQEAGEFKGTFTIGDRTGIQEKNIFIATNNLGQSQIKLSLKITIKKDVEFKPSLLFWKKGEPLQEKEVEILLNNAKFISAESDQPIFKVSAPNKGKSENVLILKVSPESTLEASRGLLKLKYINGAGTEKFSAIHLLVK